MAKAASPASSVFRVTTIAVGLGLTSCNQDPYAVSVHKVNETAPQSAAAIQLSDPQIYARETMLNDRRKEVEFLQDVLNKSPEADFQPQLKRILQFAESFRGSATAGFDQGLRTQLRRDDEVRRAEADNALKLAQLQGLMLDRQRNDLIKNLDTPPQSGETKPQIDSAAQQKISTLETRVTALENEKKDLETKLKDKRAKENPIAVPDAGRPRSAEIVSTPQEAFRDRMAYRAEVRAALAGAELDDSHDYSGNSLYRLQFTATVAPGEHKDKFGVARLTIIPPNLSIGEIANLYRLWLSHVSFRLNGLAQRSTVSLRSDPAYLALAAQRDLFRYVNYGLSEQTVIADGKVASGATLRVVVPPHLYSSARVILDTKEYNATLELLQNLVGETAEAQQALRQAAPMLKKLAEEKHLKEADSIKAKAALAAADTEVKAAEAERTEAAKALRIASDLVAEAERPQPGMSAEAAASRKRVLADVASQSAQALQRAETKLENLHAKSQAAKSHADAAEAAGKRIQAEDASIFAGIRYNNNSAITSADYTRDTARYLAAVAAMRGGNVKCLDTGKAIELRGLYPTNNESLPQIALLKQRYRAVFELIDPGPVGTELSSTLAASLRGMGDWASLDVERPKIEALLDRILQIQNWADQLRQVSGWSNDAKGTATDQSLLAGLENLEQLKPVLSTAADCHEAQHRSLVPAVFQQFIGQAHYESGQGAFAYAATPQELAQRVSTVASAITSMELGLTVAAQLQGVNAGADLSYLRSAKGQVDALERLPIVVGFSDRSDSSQTVRFSRLPSVKPPKAGSKEAATLLQSLSAMLGGTSEQKTKEFIEKGEIKSGTKEYDQARLFLSQPFMSDTPLPGFFEPNRDKEICFPYKTYLEKRQEVSSKFPFMESLSDRHIERCGYVPQKAQFGWVFGPQASLDPKDKAIRLEQVMRSYPVVADVSLPAWWPYATFLYETAWIGNWHGNNAILKNTDPAFVTRRTFHRPLPRNRADLDGLTEAIAYRGMGGSLASTSIARVEPSNLLYCGDEITLLAYGANVWRGTEAFLNGVKEKSLRVLPDMSGLAITFDTGKLQRNAASNGTMPRDRLVVWGRNGAADVQLTVTKDPNCTSKDNSAVAPQGVLSKTYLLGDSKKLSVAFAPPLEAFSSIKLEARPEPQQGGVALAWTQFAATTAYAADGKTLDLDLSALPNTLISFADGTPLELRLQVAKRPGAADTPLPIATRPIYYTTEAKTKVTVALDSGGTTLSKLDDLITLKFPPGFARAFPNLDKLGVENLKIASTDATPITFDTESFTKPTADTRSFTLRVSSGIDPAKLRDAARSIKIEFIGKLDLPGVSCAPSCLTLPQKQQP